MHSEQFLIELYNNNDKTFINFISRNFGHLIYIFIIIKVINEFFECFFIQEKKIKRIFIRGKNKLAKIKCDLLNLIRKSEKLYIVLIVVAFIIFLFSFIYISCFNDVYYYTRFVWIKSSIIIFITIQILYLVINLIEAILRFLSIKCKSEKIFNLSKLLL